MRQHLNQRRIALAYRLDDIDASIELNGDDEFLKKLKKAFEALAGIYNLYGEEEFFDREKFMEYERQYDVTIVSYLDHIRQLYPDHPERIEKDLQMLNDEIKMLDTVKDDDTFVNLLLTYDFLD